MQTSVDELGNQGDQWEKIALKAGDHGREGVLWIECIVVESVPGPVTEQLEKGQFGRCPREMDALR